MIKLFIFLFDQIPPAGADALTCETIFMPSSWFLNSKDIIIGIVLPEKYHVDLCSPGKAGVISGDLIFEIYVRFGSAISGNI